MYSKMFYGDSKQPEPAMNADIQGFNRFPHATDFTTTDSSPIDLFKFR